MTLPDVIVTVDGAMSQVAYCGAPVQVSLTVPEKPAPPAIARAYVAVFSPLTLLVVDPPGEVPIVRVGTPVPASVTVCGVVGALSVTVSVPVREPVAEGVKRTVIVHEVPAARLAPQAFVSEKSPVAAIPLMASGAFPVFVS